MSSSEHRTQHTRVILSESLFDLLSRMNYEDITVQRITEHANLNRATFYLHFRSKEELLTYVLASQFNSILSDIKGKEGEWVVLYEHVASQSGLYKMLLGSHGRTVVIHYLLDYITKDRAAQYEASEATRTLDIPYELLGRHFAGSLYGLLTWWLENEMPYSPKEMGRLTKQLATYGTASILKE